MAKCLFVSCNARTLLHPTYYDTVGVTAKT